MTNDEAACMRGLLDTLASYLDDILTNGIPKQGRGRDAGCAHAQWIEDRADAVSQAREMLATLGDGPDRLPGEADKF